MEGAPNTEKLNKTLESDPYKKYGLKYAGAGAEYIVFETIASRKKLVKINKNEVKRKIRILLGTLSRAPAERDAQFSRDMEKQRDSMRERKNRQDELIDIFGAEHVLEKGFLKMKLPITKELVFSIFPEMAGVPGINNLKDREIYEVPSIVETQVIAKELLDPIRYDLFDLSTTLIRFDHFRESRDVEDAKNKIKELVNKRFVPKVTKIVNSKKYKEILRAITERLIQYTKKTGLLLDIFGPHNVAIFTNDKGEGDYHIIDAIHPASKEYLSKKQKDDTDGDLLRMNYTYLYTVNRLAEMLEIEGLKEQDFLYFSE